MRAAHRGVIAGIVLIWVVLVLLISPAQAHTTLVSSVPGDGTVIDTPPSAVELVFSEPVDPRFVTVVVSRGDGTQWQEGAPVALEAVVSQAVRPLVDAGDYTVAYRVVSADGHPVAGQLRFSVSPAVTPTATATAMATTTPNATPSTVAAGGSTPAARSRSTDENVSGTAAWTYAAIGLPVVALLFAGGMVLARSRGRARS